MIHDSSEWREARDAQLLEWFGGDRSAVEFLLAVSSICEVWDDLVDKDKEISRETLDSVFFDALVTLPTNEFFNRHKSFFIPLIIQGINAWQDSVVLEKGGPNDRAYALTLRLFLVQLAPMIVLLQRGKEAARKVSVEMWKAATCHDDPLEWIKGGSHA
jgi:hypothetical protein